MYVETCFSKKWWENGQNKVCNDEREWKTKVHGMEIYWLTGKENFSVQWTTKKAMLIAFWDTKNRITTDFLKSPINKCTKEVIIFYTIKMDIIWDFFFYQSNRIKPLEPKMRICSSLNMNIPLSYIYVFSFSATVMLQLIFLQ